MAKLRITQIKSIIKDKKEKLTIKALGPVPNLLIFT